MRRHGSNDWSRDVPKKGTGMGGKGNEVSDKARIDGSSKGRTGILAGLGKCVNVLIRIVI